MLDVINDILQNSRVIQRPPRKLRHLRTHPRFPVPGAVDFMHFDLYECENTGACYLRQSGGILGETLWYQQNEPTPVASAPADATERHETNP